VSSEIADIMDAVVSVLQGADLGVTFAASRAYVLPEDISTISGVAISVRPASLAIHGADLGRRISGDWGVAVIVQGRTLPDAASVDPLMDAVARIARMFLARPLPGTDARCVAASADPPFDPDKLDVDGVFQAVITLTFRVTK
jgi:hypothetical protein